MSTDRRDDGQPGDPAVDQAWRAAAIDGPSTRVDAAIVTAARAATARAQPPPRVSRHWWSHWQPLAAAAGVAGLAFTIVQMLPREAGLPATPSAERAVEGSPHGPGEGATRESAATPPPREAATEDHATARRASRAPSPPSQPSADAATRDVAGAMAEADASSEQRLGEFAAPAATTATPEVWARRIEALYRAGDEDEAAKVLRAFREAHPAADDYLPGSLRSWAASVQDHPAPAKEPAGMTP